MAQELLCYCFKIYKQQVIDIVRSKNPRTVEDVQQYCRASMGCGGCRLDIEELIEEFSKAKLATKQERNFCFFWEKK